MEGRGLTGESSTDPTEFMFVRSKNSSPILRMISRHGRRDGEQIQEPDGDSAVGHHPPAHTFVRHVNLARLADYLRYVFRFVDGG